MPELHEPGHAAAVVGRWVGFGRSSFRAVLQRILRSWAARSLQVGALCTVVDVAVVVTLVRVLKVPTPLGSAGGVAVGSTLAFILNRHFAFRDKSSPVGPQAFRYALTTLGAMAVHAPLVGILVDRLDVDLVVAKLMADVLVFSVGQLLLLRFLVFRKSPAVRGAHHGDRAESG
jgi:putative flippase GtrA